MSFLCSRLAPSFSEVIMSDIGFYFNRQLQTIGLPTNLKAGGPAIGSLQLPINYLHILWPQHALLKERQKLTLLESENRRSTRDDTRLMRHDLVESPGLRVTLLIHPNCRQQTQDQTKISEVRFPSGSFSSEPIMSYIGFYFNRQLKTIGLPTNQKVGG